MADYRTFTSESVSEGHPDKVADQISDAILDAVLEQDPDCRVACETLVKSDFVVIAGEIRTSATVDTTEIARQVIRDIGYTGETGIDPDTCEVVSHISEQSADIAQGVDREEQGAGDQGMMFGYSTSETDVLMPAPIAYAHRLMRRHAELRRAELNYLRPDAKCQLTFDYNNGTPMGINTVVFSTQHDPTIEMKDLKEAVVEEIVKDVIPRKWLQETDYKINPTGRFVDGGPQADCGLTGRKIIVDTYGGMAHHGGGAFSGKDPSKVDRSAAYAARYVAKNVVAAGLANKCEVQISYAIGQAEPTSVDVNTFDTAAENVTNEDIRELILNHFDLRPKSIIEMLDLKKPIYRKTATNGHFGRNDETFTWERTDRADLMGNRS